MLLSNRHLSSFAQSQLQEGLPLCHCSLVAGNSSLTSLWKTYNLFSKKEEEIKVIRTLFIPNGNVLSDIAHLLFSWKIKCVMAVGVNGFRERGVFQYWCSLFDEVAAKWLIRVIKDGSLVCIFYCSRPAARVLTLFLLLDYKASLMDILHFFF